MTQDFYQDAVLFMRGFQISKMMHVAAELGIADRIAAGPRSVSDLAAEAGALPDLLRRMLRALSAYGLFALDANDLVSHTPRSQYLRSNSTPTLHYALRFWGMESMWATWGNMHETIRTGTPAFELTYGMPNFDYLREHPEQSGIFDAFMQHSPDDRHAAVAAAYDFSSAGVVADVGGGNGGLLRAILDAHQGVRGLLADQAAVIAGAPAVLGAQAARCDAVPTNFFESVPAGGDIYTMAQILHDWSDERCLVILAKVRAAIPADGRLLIIERVLDDEPTKNPPASYLGDMQMMALFPGARERTVAEFNDLFQRTGFRPGRLIPTRSPFSIMETTPA